jgi:hypothetical protein
LWLLIAAWSRFFPLNLLGATILCTRLRLLSSSSSLIASPFYSFAAPICTFIPTLHFAGVAATAFNFIEI